MNQTLADYCTHNPANNLLSQWDTDKNQPLTPATISSSSHKKVWWVCPKGHHWQAAVYSRTAGSGCPVCANRRILSGVNDLATTHPDIARQWHPTKNAPLTPDQVVYGTHRKVWWQCQRGHIWLADINSRAKGIGCPYCSNKIAIPGENDLASKYPELAAQWLQRRNGSLHPEDVVFGSNRVVWWQCERGHTWCASIVLRTLQGYGCPYCAGRYVLEGFNDLQTLHPEIAQEWHPTLNEPLTAAKVTVSSNRKVWWKCQEGHVWKTAVYNRTATRATHCPICAGNITPAKQRFYDRIAREAALSSVTPVKN